MLLSDAPARPGATRPPGRRIRFAAWAGIAFVIASTLVAAAPRSAPDVHSATEPPIYEMVYGTSDQVERISVAHNRLVSDCMTRLGFDYDAASQPGSTVDRPAPFGLESVDPPAPDTQFTEDTSRATEAYVRALYGPPNDRVAARGKRISVSRPASGCVADAERQLLGSQRVRWIQLRILLFEAEEDARKRLEQDPEFRAVTTRWHLCMRQAGFDWPDPLRLLDGLPKDADVRTHPAGLADVRCKHETAYLTTAYARLSAAQREVLDADPSMVRDWTALLNRQDAAARTSSPRKMP